MQPLRLASVTFLLLGTLYASELLYAYKTIPLRDTSLTHFDALIVLGNPAEDDGTPSPEQRKRAVEGVHEYQLGIAPHIIFTGGAVLNRFQEGHVMAQMAESMGVPRDAIVEETEARNTIQNIHFSYQIMQAHGWHSAEVISSPSHLPRASLILAHYKGPAAFAWQTRSADWPPGYWHKQPIRYFMEANACLLFRALGFHPSEYLPGGR